MGILDHAELVLLALVLANQAGVPVFAAPVLFGVGALAFTGDVNAAVAVMVAVGASLCADLAWYSVGRRRGRWALAALRRFSRGTRVFIADAERLFRAHDRAFQLGARFLPELNPVAAAFAGVARSGFKRFVMGAAASAAMWAGAWIGAGYLIGGATSGGGSGIALFAMIVVASVIASLAVAIRSAARAIIAAWRSLRVRAPARPSDEGLRTDRVVRNRRPAC